MRITLRAVLVAGSVPNVAFDDVLLTIQEQSGSAGGQSAVLVVVTL